MTQQDLMRLMRQVPRSFKLYHRHVAWLERPTSTVWSFLLRPLPDVMIKRYFEGTPEYRLLPGSIAYYLQNEAFPEVVRDKG